MKKYFRNIFLFLVLSYLSPSLHAQKYANKHYYLIDSLSLNALSTFDKSLIDSCLDVYHKLTPDTLKLYTINYIIENVWDQNIWPKYNAWLLNYCKLKLSQTNLSINEQKLYAGLLANAIGNVGYLLRNTGHVEEAMQMYMKAVPIVEKYNDKRGKASLYNNMGVCYLSMGNITKALDYYHMSLSLREELNDYEGILMSLNNLGYLYKYYGDSDEGIRHYERALKISQRIGDKIGMAAILNNLGDIYYHNYGDTINGLNYVLKSLNLSKELGDKKGVAYSLNSLSNIYLKMGQKEEAMSTAKECLKIRKEIHDLEGISNSLSSLGRLYYEAGNILEAEKLTKEGYNLALKTSILEDLDHASNILHRIYFQQKKYKEAYQVFQVYFQTRDSLQNVESQKAIVKQRLRYDFNRKRMNDSIQHYNEQELGKYELSKKTAELKTEQTRLVALLICIVLLSITTYIVYTRFKLTRSQNTLIQNQKKIVEEKQKEIVDSIYYAKRIQNTLLASSELLKEYLKEYFVLFKPKDIVSGDFYWATNKNNKFYLAVCDATGHGVPGAFVSLLNIGFLAEAINEKGLIHPNEIFDFVRQRLIDNISKDDQKDGFDGILICLDLLSGRITYSSANNKSIHIGNLGHTELESDRMPVGYDERKKSFQLFQLNYQKGDMLYLYTDGIADQFGGENGKKLKYKNFNNYLITLSKLEINQQALVLERYFEEWKGELEQVDDLCVFGIKL